jgi:prolyl-tRNA synthetase
VTSKVKEIIFPREFRCNSKNALPNLNDFALCVVERGDFFHLFIGLYQFHRPDPKVPFAESVTLAEAVTVSGAVTGNGFNLTIGTAPANGSVVFGGAVNGVGTLQVRGTAALNGSTIDATMVQFDGAVTGFDVHPGRCVGDAVLFGLIRHREQGYRRSTRLGIRIIADQAIQGIQGAVTGANEADAHYIEVDQERDFTPALFADLRLIAAGDLCPRCQQGRLALYRGIEVGQVFYLGKKYSEALGATFLDAEGRERHIEMGCYGIGISRLVAATVEQHSDSNGIIWPFSIAPLPVLLLPINYKDTHIQQACDGLYAELEKCNIRVLLDDRDERPGVKFKDADLIGLPLRVTIGAKGLEKGRAELRWRRDGKVEEVLLSETTRRIKAILGAEIRG